MFCRDVNTNIIAYYVILPLAEDPTKEYFVLKWKGNLIILHFSCSTFKWKMLSSSEWWNLVYLFSTQWPLKTWLDLIVAWKSEVTKTIFQQDSSIYMLIMPHYTSQCQADPHIINILDWTCYVTVHKQITEEGWIDWRHVVHSYKFYQLLHLHCFTFSLP